VSADRARWNVTAHPSVSNSHLGCPREGLPRVQLFVGCELGRRCDWSVEQFELNARHLEERRPPEPTRHVSAMGVHQNGSLVELDASDRAWRAPAGCASADQTRRHQSLASGVAVPTHEPAESVVTKGQVEEAVVLRSSEIGTAVCGPKLDQQHPPRRCDEHRARPASSCTSRTRSRGGPAKWTGG
jgi:hypothetical protein